MAQYIFDRALTVTGKFVNANTKIGVEAGHLAFFADQVQEPALNLTLETEEVRDARNNLIAVLANGRSATFSAANAFFNTSILAAQAGAKVDGAIGDEITRYEVVEVNDAGTGVIAYDAKAGSAVAYKLTDDGSYSVATPMEGVTVTGKAVSGATGAKKILVEYVAVVKGDSSEKIVALADSENELLNVTAEILVRDLCDQATYLGILKMKGKLSGEVDWSMARDGNHPFEFTVLPDYCGGRQLFELIIVKDDEMTATEEAGA